MARFSLNKHLFPEGSSQNAVSDIRYKRLDIRDAEVQFEPASGLAAKAVESQS